MILGESEELVILATRNSRELIHEMSFVIIDGDDPKLGIKRMGSLTIICDQEEDQLGKVVPGTTFQDGDLTILTKNLEGNIKTYHFHTISTDVSTTIYADPEYPRISF